MLSKEFVTLQKPAARSYYRSTSWQLPEQRGPGNIVRLNRVTCCGNENPNGARNLNRANVPGEKYAQSTKLTARSR